MALPTMREYFDKKDKEEKTKLPRPQEIVPEYATQLEVRKETIETGKKAVGPFVQPQTIKPMQPNPMNTQPLSLSQPTLQRSFASSTVTNKPEPKKTLKETVQPLKMQQPELKKTYTDIRTPEDKREAWVSERMKQDARGTAASPIISAINTALQPLSNAVYTGASYLAPLQRGAGNALNIQADTAPYEPTFGNKALEIGGVIAGSLTNPTNLSQGVANLGYRGGAALAQRAGQAIPKLNNRFTQSAIQGASAGAAQGALLSGVRGETDLGQLATNTALGAALGGAGDTALTGIGQLARNVINKYRSKPVVPTEPTLSLPASRQRGNVNAAVTDNVITPDYTFKLPEPNANTTTRLNNVVEGKQEIKVLDDEIRRLEADYERAVVDEYNYLKQSLKERAGVQQGQLVQGKDGQVTNRVGRISNNPKWYQDYYAQNGRVPSNKELYRIARERVDNGFADETGNVPSWKAQNNYDEMRSTLQGVRDTIQQSIRDLDPTIKVADSPIIASELSFTPVPRRQSNDIVPTSKQQDPESLRESARRLQELHDSNVRQSSPLEKPKESWFERLFGRQGVGIAAGKGQAKELIDTHVTRNAKEQAPIIERFKDAATIAHQDYVDKFAPFRAISNDTYNAAMDSTRANNLANVTIKDKFVDLEGNVRGNSLKDIYSIVPRGQKDLADRYLIMRDAVDRMDRGIRVYGDKEWFPQTSQEAAQRVAQMETQAPWLKQFGEEWNQFNRNRQDLWVESGIASRELVDALRASNPNYTPMQRQMPNRGLKNVMRFNQKEFSGQKAPVRRAVGSSRKIIEPAQSMINSTASSYHAMMRNRAMQNLYDAVVADPRKYHGIVEIVEDTDAAKQATLKQINEIIEQDGLDGLADLLNSEIDTLFTKSKQTTARPTDNHVTVMVNGNPVKMNIQEKSLLRAIEGVTPERLEGLLRIADTLSRGVKVAATGALAPMQGLKLFLRDIPVAFAQSKDKNRFLFDISHAMVSQIADWLPDFVPGARNLGKLARNYYRAGGGYEQYLSGDSRIRAAASDITRDPLLSGRNITKQIRKTQLGLRPFKELGDAFENIPRIAAFQAAMRKNGWSHSEAAVRQALNDAREATVNWSRKGARGQQIESVLPYSNAAVQGTYRLAKFMREQPVSALGLITAVTGATIGAYEQFKDDPDYKHRSKYAKGIPVYKTDNGKFVTIPVEPAYQYIADQVLNFYKWAQDQEKIPDARESIQTGLDAFTPKYVAGPASLLTAQQDRWSTAAANTFGGSSLEPAIAMATGKNYFGGDIIPREYQDNSTRYQQNETTSSAANWAAENLGMDAFTFDYLAQKFGGDLAKVTLPMTSEVGRGDPAGNIMDETLARIQLLEDPIMKNNLSNEYYKYANKVSQAKANEAAGAELPSWYKPVYDQVTSQKKGSITKAISDLNSEKKSIQRDTTLTAKQRADQLRQVQTEINLLRIKGIEIMEKAGVMD